MAQQKLDIVLVERLGGLKMLSVKEFNVDDLYKKCGFKKADGFDKQVEWSVKLGDLSYVVQMYAKKDGRANSENKYDFPPPVDTSLFYGTCALVALDGATRRYVPLSVGLWNQLYEKLFGGFEDLSHRNAEDEKEEDELEHVSKDRKTKHGYLKDGFVVDSEDSEGTPESEEEEAVSEQTHTEEEDIDDESSEACSELSEESYDYDDEHVGKE